MTASNPFAKTRSDHSQETARDVVELILRMGKSGDADQPQKEVRTVDLVKALEVSQPTVTKILMRLEREGLLLVHKRQSIELTEEGRKLAAESLKTHELVKAFLEAIGVSSFQAEMDTEGIEHHLSAESLECMKRFIESNRSALKTDS